MELGEEAQDVHVERWWVSHPLEAVGRDVMAALDFAPSIRVGDGEPQDRAHDLPEHRPEVRAGVLRIVDLGTQAGLAHGEPAGHGKRGHPDVDPELGDLRRPVPGLQVVADEVAGNAEVAADRLADAEPVERPGQRVRDVVRDRAVVLVPRVERGDIVIAALQDRPGQELDPLGTDAPQVGVDDHQRLDFQSGRDLEDRAQRGALATDPVDLGVGERDARELVRRADQQDPLDVVRRLRLHDDTLRAVGRSRIGVDDHGPEVGEVLDQPSLSRTHDIADRRGVLETRDADHDVRPFEAGNLFSDGRCQHGLRHSPTVPPMRRTARFLVWRALIIRA